jgi:hypothetical protein
MFSLKYMLPRHLRRSALPVIEWIDFFGPFEAQQEIPAVLRYWYPSGVNKSLIRCLKPFEHGKITSSEG